MLSPMEMYIVVSHSLVRNARADPGIFFRKGGSTYWKGGSKQPRGVRGYAPRDFFLEISIANGAFLINLDHQLRAEISPICSRYFS